MLVRHAKAAFCNLTTVICGLFLYLGSTAHADWAIPANIRTAPTNLPKQSVFATVFVNEVKAASVDVKIDGYRVTIPHAALAALRLENVASDALELVPGGAMPYTWDASTSTLRITASPLALQTLKLGFDPAGDPALALSPESYGAWMNYDMNVRHDFGGNGRSTALPLGLNSGALTEFHVAGPNMAIYSAWSYDSARLINKTARLDTYATWRPADRELAFNAGDFVSPFSSQARPFRYLGVEVGTDHSAQPGFRQNPIPQVTGTAAAQSNIDVYVNNQRLSQSETAGGPFKLTLPHVGPGDTASIIATDVTGKQVILSVEAPQVDAQILREGLLLWSAGMGVPRFGYGATSSDYGSDGYVHATGRYGLTSTATMIGHSEGGFGIGEAELGANVALDPRVSLQVNSGVSKSMRATGAFGKMAIVIAGPWGFFLDSSVSRASRGYDDIVSVSGRSHAAGSRNSWNFSLPATEYETVRLSWRTARDLTLSASFARYAYPGTGEAGFAGLSAQATIGGLPVFLSYTTSLGGSRNASLLAGVTLLFGGQSASLSAGRDGSGLNGSGATSQSLDDGVGSVGWQAIASHSADRNAFAGLLETRTGYGIPGLQLDSFGGGGSAYAIGRGAAGFVSRHAFVGDPVQGGIVVADAGAAGVPITINGYSKGTTGWDGKMSIPVAVPGTPQTISISTDEVPIDLVPTETDKTATVREGGATTVQFGLRNIGASVSVTVTDNGRVPPAGSVLASANSSAPVNNRGRAYLPAVLPAETLTMTRPDGTVCTVVTSFDGKGGPLRRIGPFPCSEKAM